MIRSKLITTVAAAAIMVAAPLSFGTMPLPLGTSAAQAHSVSISFNLFFDELEPHGVWVRHSKYRYVWCPTVSTRWAPYTHGSWVYLRDYGWYFQSSEPFAWAVYHYGRWYDDEDLGWCWVPGTRWAPAWVSWRRTNDFVGWAPLPPQEEGFQFSVEITVGDVEPDDWFFVPVRQFVRPNLSFEIVFGDQRRELFERSEFVGTVAAEDNRVFNTSLELNFIQQNIQQDITIYNTEVVESSSETQAEPQGDTLNIFQASVEEPADNAEPPEAVEQEEAKQVLAQERPEDEPVESDTDAPADDAATETDDEATEAKTETDAATETDEVTAEDCVGGERFVEGECVPVDDEVTEGDETTGTDAQVTTETDAEATTATDADATTETDADATTEADAQATTEADAQATTETDADVITETDEVTAADCLEGEEFVNGACVPAETVTETTEPAAADTQPATDETTEPTEQTEPTEPAEATEPEEPASATEPAPATEEVPAGPTEADCLAEGLRLVDGVCVPVEETPAQ
jgi:hypothetical protein